MFWQHIDIILITFKHLRKHYFKRYIGDLLKFRIFTSFQVNNAHHLLLDLREHLCTTSALQI